MLFFKKKITVTVKLYGGIDTDIGLDGYDPACGVALVVRDGERLKKAVKQIQLHKAGGVVWFVNGNPAKLNQKLNQGDVVLCMRPAAGG